MECERFIQSCIILSKLVQSHAISSILVESCAILKYLISSLTPRELNMDFSFFHRFWGDYFGTDEAPVEGKKSHKK